MVTAFGQVKARIAALVAKPLQGVTQGVANQSQLINLKFEKLIKGSENQSQLLDQRLGALVKGLDNQSKLLNSGFERLVMGIDNLAKLVDARSGQLLPEPAPSKPAPAEKPAANAPLTSADCGSYRRVQTNDLGAYADVFADIKPWSGKVPRGFLVDFWGTQTRAEYQAMFGVVPDRVGGAEEKTRVPSIADGEGWFEAVNWVAAAREARGRYVMVTLGACYGSQAVGSYRALQALNPLPYKLVAVEPDPENMAWTVQHFRDNGIDPDQQWLVQAALSDTNAPVFFPVGSPGTGAQNCFSTNELGAREAYVRELIARGADNALRNLLLHNSTGITKSLVPGRDFNAEVKLLSAVTLRDILCPFAFVDYLEADIQQSEILVFPPFMELLKKKVRRVHIGTHGRDVHLSLQSLLEKDGWDIVFNYEPNSDHTSALGSFKTNDGVLTARNPHL